MTTCQCPERLHCASRRKHPACKTCHQCSSTTPATCLNDGDFCHRHGEYRPCFDCQMPAAHDADWRGYGL